MHSDGQIHLPLFFDAIQRTLVNLNFDCLIFADTQSDAESLLLSQSRYASVQVRFYLTTPVHTVKRF